jgi:hypothetical protein
MSASDIFVQVTATPMGGNSGQAIANPRTVMVKVPGHRIDIHRETHREESADATSGQLAEYLASDAALHLLAKLRYSGIGTIDTIALTQRPEWTDARLSDFTYEEMTVWLA